jgi:hypothetical protein
MGKQRKSKYKEACKVDFKHKPQDTRKKMASNKRLEAARRQIKDYLTSQGVVIKGMDPQKLYMAFLSHLGIWQSGIKARDQVEAIYLDTDNDIIGRDESSGNFYRSMPWVVLRSRILAKYGRVCMKCGATSDITVDHIKPRSLYPELELEFDNMQVLCRCCNSAKNNKDTTDYRTTSKLPT